MRKHSPMIIAVVCAIMGVASAADSFAMPSAVIDQATLDKLAGQPVDIVPWTYQWRADREVQEKPEAYFIPRRLDRINKVYRTAFHTLPPDQLKSPYYDMPDLLTPLPPPPKGELQAGLLWTGRLSQYQVELQWPEGVQQIPPAAVEVRVYPTSFGWFGWTVDKVLANPEISADGRTWTYKIGPPEKMDSSYSTRVDAATEMIAVFYEKGKTPAIPSIRVTGPSVGEWKRMDLEMEWGFQTGTEKNEFDGRLESHVAMVGPVSPLADDKGTTAANGPTWQSRGIGNTRRGIVVPVLYAPDSRPGLDSRVTVWTKNGGFTIRIADLETGPILIPNQGVYVAKAGSGKTARQFADELAAKNLKSICQMTREHRESLSWEEALQEVRLWTCVDGTPVPPFPQVENPPMRVQLSDSRWTDAWRVSSAQLRGPHMWGGLAYEVGRVTHEMDMVGLHDEADKVYQHFLKSPGVKSEGDYADGDGSLEWATSMRHDMGYSHDGTHASTGRLLFGMADRYFLTGDKEWFLRNRARLQAAADWIIRQRRTYMKDIPNRQELLVAGLMPPYMLGDYALPACDWHWYYMDNAFSLQGLQRFADALAEFDPETARKYRDEADAFRADICRAVERDAALAPVRQGRDGMFHSFIPKMAYAQGLTGMELDAPHYGHGEMDRFLGALPLAEPFAALNANAPVLVDTLDLMEELGMAAPDVLGREAARKESKWALPDAWFWETYAELPKVSHNANIYLLRDDVTNFLRFWINAYVAIVGADGRMWEHWQFKNFEPCNAPDNGTAGWFLENFRNLLVMEDGDSMWIARATPRAWLEQGKKISVQNAPTYFGSLAYEIVSDVEHGKIVATIEIPSRHPPKSVFVRFRHPTAAPIQSVTVNGQPWDDFDSKNEVIQLTGVNGTVSVVASY